MKFMRTRIEKDFELFVKALPSLEAVEFAGLAKILGVKMVNSEVEFDREEFESLKDNEAMQAKLTESLLPMDQILEKMMDRYLELPKRRRREINDILKEIKRTKKNEVSKNGATT